MRSIHNAQDGELPAHGLQLTFPWSASPAVVHATANGERAMADGKDPAEVLDIRTARP